MNNQLIKPLEYAEQNILKDILEGEYPPGSNLPSEREYAEKLGVTRPTLREALGRIERDGWITIQHGKPTAVNDYWKEGGLNILSTLTKMGGEMDWKLVFYVLQVRTDIAPNYTYHAVLKNPGEVKHLLSKSRQLDDDANAYAQYDWEVHHQLTVLSENPIYPLILNGFEPLYNRLAQEYFSGEQERALSKFFYQELLKATENGDPAQAKNITNGVMMQSLSLMKLRSEE